MFRLIIIASAFLFATSAVAADAGKPVSVMVIGTFHWSNPNMDLHDVQVDDVNSPKRQAEITTVAEGLSRFHPTQIAAEWPADLVTKRYAEYLKGTYGVSHNEVVLLGFRLAKMNNAAVHGIDVDGEYPYGAVETYAKAHGRQDILAEADNVVVREVKKEQELLDTGTIQQTLRWINDPANEDGENAANRVLMKVGNGADQPGAELFAAWSRRNALICANLLQLAKPGDRIIVIFGAGHETFLRQCVREMPGFRLVEADDYLPQ